ncbi:MAG: antitoxin family protein [Phycisphaeraceae bacterium]|nr:antitoxin family protein [Phycisphaeraceae bacterium]MCW5768382.1 antitoxin family protein [Phycisphaeraceae bacterium]
MYREQEFHFVYEDGVLKPEERLDLPEGARGVARIRESQTQNGADSFWDHKSIEDLARTQAVAPVRSIDELVGDWPPEESVDDFLDMVRRGRA